MKRRRTQSGHVPLIGVSAFARINASWRVVLTTVMLTAALFTYAFPIEFQKSIPESGSTINSFDFTLEFDITEALVLAEQDKPGVDVGLGYNGSSKLCASLYKGDVETGTLLGQTMTANFYGKDPEFVVNGNKVNMRFDSSIPIVTNQKYTIQITNSFYLFVSGKVSKVASTQSAYAESPIILTFIGGSSETTQLDVESDNLVKDMTLSNLGAVEFTLNSPFTINSGAEAWLTEGDNVVAKTSDLKISPDNNKVLIADFGGQALNYGHTYSVVLPANALAHIDDPSVGNFEYKTNSISGSQTYGVALASTKVDVDTYGIPTAVTFLYDLTAGATVVSSYWNLGYKDGFLSVEGSEEATNFEANCTFVENGKGLKWDLSKVRFLPATTYTFTKAGETVVICDSKGKRLQEYTAEDARITFTTPSVEEAGFAPMIFDDPLIYTSSSTKLDYSPEMTIPNLYRFRVKLTSDGYYYVGKQKYVLYPMGNPAVCYLYEIGENEDKLLNSYSLSTYTSDGYGTYLYGYSEMLVPLYEGKKYRIVIPDGAFTAYLEIRNLGQTQDLTKAEYIRNKEISFTLNGSAPCESKLLSCSVEDGSTVSSLYNVLWTFEGDYRLSDDITTVKDDEKSASGIKTQPNYYPVTVTKSYSKTVVMVDFVSKTTGKPLHVTNGSVHTFTVPKGLIVNNINDEIVNDEITLSVVGGEEVIKAEMVNVNLTINELHSVAHKAAKGEKYSFTVAHNDNWKVSSVKQGTKTLTARNGVYETQPLNEDADIYATLDYAGPMAIDLSTGVWQVPESVIRIFKDGDRIVVDGVSADSTIDIYSIAGVHVAEAQAGAGQDRVAITVAPDHLYVVIVNGYAAKIQM